MNPRRPAVGVSLLCAAFLWSCGGDSPPTTPAVVVTPTPKAPRSPTVSPDVPPAGSACRKPYPPRLGRMNSKVHYKQHTFWMLDSTPLVGPNAGYCRQIGFTDGRSWCPVRPEGAPDRVACELWRVGTAKDTGKPGPTWSYLDRSGNELFCRRSRPADGGPAPNPPCERAPDNVFQLRAIKGGTYRVCTEGGVCSTVYVDRF